jgi:hypothetical protein
MHLNECYAFAHLQEAVVPPSEQGMVVRYGPEQAAYLLGLVTRVHCLTWGFYCMLEQ